MLTIHLENEGRSARLGLSATPAEKAVAPLEQMTPAGKVKRVQALNGQTPLPAPTPADLIDGDPELDLEIAGRLMRDATAVYLEPGATQPSIATKQPVLLLLRFDPGSSLPRRPQRSQHGSSVMSPN